MDTSESLLTKWLINSNADLVFSEKEKFTKSLTLNTIQNYLLAVMWKKSDDEILSGISLWW